MLQAGFPGAFPLEKGSKYILGYEGLRESRVNVLTLGFVELVLPTVSSRLAQAVSLRTCGNSCLGAKCVFLSL